MFFVSWRKHNPDDYHVHDPVVFFILWYIIVPQCHCSAQPCFNFVGVCGTDLCVCVCCVSLERWTTIDWLVTMTLLWSCRWHSSLARRHGIRFCCPDSTWWTSFCNQMFVGLHFLYLTVRILTNVMTIKQLRAFLTVVHRSNPLFVRAGTRPVLMIPCLCVITLGIIAVTLCLKLLHVRQMTLTSNSMKAVLW